MTTQNEIQSIQRQLMVYLDHQKILDLIQLGVNLEGDNRIDNQKSNRARTELQTRCWKGDCYANLSTTSEGVTAPSIWKGLRVPRNELDNLLAFMPLKFHIGGSAKDSVDTCGPIPPPAKGKSPVREGQTFPLVLLTSLTTEMGD